MAVNFSVRYEARLILDEREPEQTVIATGIPVPFLVVTANGDEHFDWIHATLDCMAGLIPVGIVYRLNEWRIGREEQMT